MIERSGLLIVGLVASLAAGQVQTKVVLEPGNQTSILVSDGITLLERDAGAALYNIHTGELVGEIEPEDIVPREMILGNGLVVISDRFFNGVGIVRLYDLKTLQPVAEIDGTDTMVSFGREIAMSESLLAAEYNGSGIPNGVALYDLETLELLRTIDYPDQSEIDQPILIDGLSDTRVVIRGPQNDPLTLVHDTATGDLLYTLDAGGLDVDIDDKRLVIGDRQKEIVEVFDPATGDLLMTLDVPFNVQGGGPDFSSGVSLLGDLLLVGANLDEPVGSAYLFDLSSGDLLLKLTANGESDQFGQDVGLGDGAAVIGNDNDYWFFDLDAPSIVLREGTQGSWECGAGAGGAGACLGGWDHVGLAVDGIAFESHSGYDPLVEYYDPNTDEVVVVPQTSGVQVSHTLGTFRQLGPIGFPAVQSVALAIPGASEDTGEQMRDFIQSQFGADFLPLCDDLADVTCWRDGLSTAAQKGLDGAEFTSAGLIERASEVAGLDEGQGLIPDGLESWSVVGLGKIPALSPHLLGAFLQKPEGTTAPPLVGGSFGAIDFMLTDPAGRRLGETQALGLIEEIAHAFYTGDGEVEQFVIFDPKPGEYVLELFGLDASASVLLGGAIADQVVFEGPLGSGAQETITFTLGECAADVNGDGAADVFDFVAFQTAFQSGAAEADCTDDATLNVFDFVCFQQAFASGCP